MNGEIELDQDVTDFAMDVFHSRRECIGLYRHNMKIWTSHFSYENNLHLNEGFDENYDIVMSLKRNFEEYRDTIVPMHKGGYLEMVNDRFITICDDGFEAVLDDISSLSLFDGVKVNYKKDSCTVSAKFGKKEDLSKGNGIVYQNPELTEEVNVKSVRFRLNEDDMVVEVELNTTLMCVGDYVKSLK